MRKFATHPEYIAIFIRIAVNFLVRAGHFTEDEAKFEIEMISERIGVAKFVEASGRGKFCNEPYITMIRVGATVKKNRKARVEVAMTLDRAAEHALYVISRSFWIGSVNQCCQCFQRRC